MVLQAATARPKKKGQWSTVQGQVISAPESRRSVGIERPRDLVVGLERSYKSQEEIWRSHTPPLTSTLGVPKEKKRM